MRYRRSKSKLLIGALALFCLFLLAGCPKDELSEGDQVGQPLAEPTIEELGLRLMPKGVDINGLSQAEVDRVARGSYLVNGAGDCGGCHTTPNGGYLAGGLEFPLFPDIQGFTSVFSRNLTPDPETGLRLTQDQFIEVIRTGKDFEDSTELNPQRLIIIPFHIFRFMSLEDLNAVYAYLRVIPPVKNGIRKSFIPPFPFPPISFPAIGDGDSVSDPNNSERGLSIPQFFSSGAGADAFVNQFNTTLAGLTPEEKTKVGRGSYLVNSLGGCNSCHTDNSGDHIFDEGLIPFSVDVDTTAYLAGGVNLGIFFPGLGDIFSRNLTPHPTTGLFLTEEQFIQVLRFGADFRRPGKSLRVEPHFPTRFHHTLDDLKAIYAYLKAIPAVNNSVAITP